MQDLFQYTFFLTYVMTSPISEHFWKISSITSYTNFSAPLLEGNSSYCKFPVPFCQFAFIPMWCRDPYFIPHCVSIYAKVPLSGGANHILQLSYIFTVNRGLQYFLPVRWR